MDASLDQATTLVGACRGVVDAAVRRLAADSAAEGRLDLGLMDREQVLGYDLSTVASKVAAAEELLDYGQRGELERLVTVAFAGEVAADIAGRMTGREDAWAAPEWLSGDVRAALLAARSPALAEAIAEAMLSGADLPRHLDDELELVRQTFRDYAEAKVAPIAEHVHRTDADIPEEIIAELADMGCFGLSIPEQHGGFAEGGPDGDALSMVVVTEELARGSLGVAGSLITRPEILSKALLKGGTPEQQQRWLPAMASGELMCAVAVTEPDYGSDVANLKTSAVREGDVYLVNGTKTWCTFAGRADLLMLLARTDPDPAKRHRGLSLLVVEKPPYPGHQFTHSGAHGGKLTARAIGTIGYRGMHSFELSFEDYAVPVDNLVGGQDGLGRGFYLQMEAFANGRLQTAARALGVMQAACDAAVSYANQRRVFGLPLGDYQLTKGKLAKMACLIAACRQFSYRAAQLLGAGHGQLEASMAKSLSCLAAEWVTREAQQIHGGMGYAEEYPVSRYFVDARVLSIFEGADETLALRVIIRRLLEQALRAGA
ncbi:MAG: acyl-CoA dehydrogenase family protein [Actinomycetota bacterium]|nr:acyl-CoA dehydrogenase family protein [Actinomycetota bacterium]